MKPFYFLLCCLFSFDILSAQVCLPDSLFKDSTAGVYPKPLTAANPKGGINKKACINKPYEFVFTVVIPDTVTVPGFGTIGLNSAQIATSNAIKGLPKGIDYQCNPSNCTFNAKTMGCIILNGIPDNSNTPGNYKPVISLKLNTVFGPFTVDYPGSIFPGEYILELLDENCQVSTYNADESKAYWWPNPSNGELYSSGEQLIQNLSITDLVGRIVYFDKNPGSHSLRLGNELSKGIYMIQWSDGNRTYKQKIWVTN